MPRKRNKNKKRQDYRKGGRVGYAPGGPTYKITNADGTPFEPLGYVPKPSPSSSPTFAPATEFLGSGSGEGSSPTFDPTPNKNIPSANTTSNVVTPDSSTTGITGLVDNVFTPDPVEPDVEPDVETPQDPVATPDFVWKSNMEMDANGNIVIRGESENPGEPSRTTPFDTSGFVVGQKLTHSNGVPYTFDGTRWIRGQTTTEQNTATLDNMTAEKNLRALETGRNAESLAKGDFSNTSLGSSSSPSTIPDAKTILDPTTGLPRTDIDPATGLPRSSTTLDPSDPSFQMQAGTDAVASGVADSMPAGYSDTAPPEFNYPADMPPDGMKWAYGPNGERKAVSQNATSNEIVSTGTAAAGSVGPGVATSTFEAAKAGTTSVTAAEGTVTGGPIQDIQGQLTAAGPAAFISEAEAAIGVADNVDAIISGNAFVPEVKNTGAGVAANAQAEINERQAITGNAQSADSAQIIGIVGYQATKSRAVTGTAAIGAAANMVAEVANIPSNIAAAVVEDPATMVAQLAGETVEVQAAIAALPTEALVSSQMETLLGGLENGTIPTWAKPAVDAVNQGMAQRGLSVSTVGRDSLFNAIIQSAFPMAQSNAQALQARATQNLNNQQQANLQGSTQEQQLRLQNLANRQDASSQTAQYSQQMKTLQSQFNQQAVLTSAEQAQVTRTQNLQNQQQAAVLTSQNQQQANMQTLGNEQQISMAELQIEANVEGANQNAENQQKILEMQSAADFLSKNAGFKQQMDLANLSNAQQTELANLSALNQAGAENLSAAQQSSLANLNAQMNTNIKNAELASSMGIAQLNVDQQTAMQNANMVANMDMAKFSTAQQVELANSKFMQTVQINNMSAEQQSILQNATALAAMDMANLSTRENLVVTNAKNFLTMDMANLSNEQQSNMMNSQQEQQRLLSDQASANAALQFNATSENQTNQFMQSLAANMSQFNVAQRNGMEQLNTSSANAAEARRVGNEREASKLEAQLQTQVSQFNASQEFQLEKFNTQNESAIAQSNVAWRRQANTLDTAAQNAINQQNAQNAYGMSMAAQNFLWQELKDQAEFNFRRWDNEEARKTALMVSALGNDSAATKESTNWSSTLTGITGLIKSFYIE